MASFDIDAFATITGNTGSDPLGALGTSFGIPSCALNITRDALALLPGDALLLINKSFQEGKRVAEEGIAQFYQSILDELGLVEDDSGFFTLPYGSDNGILDAIAAFGVIGAVYNELTDIAQDVESIIDCIQSIGRNFEANKGYGTPDLLNSLGISDSDGAREYVENQVKPSLEFINTVNSQIEVVNSILAERALNPDLEPCLPDSAEFDQILEGTSYRRCPVEDPGLSEVQGEEIFRLTYGPPISRDGQFLLTSDGLYYDGISGGLDPVFVSIKNNIDPGDLWTYKYDPNLGGKGDQISIDSLNKFTDNIFDLDNIDDSQGMQLYYDEDHFLSVLKQQRDKHAYDLSGELVEFIDEFGEDSAFVINQRQVIISEIANHNHKINRRKKQIEVIVKVPTLYGDETAVFEPGKIPINDFSVLEKYNLSVDLEKQKALAFSNAELDGIVLPITPKFVKSAAKAASVGFNHLTVPAVGKGSIIYSPSGQTDATVLSLNDQIVTDGLFAIYNFLDTNTSLPSSTDFNLTNCATENMYNNAQLIGTNPQNIFFSGLAVPYLEGLVKNKSTFPQGASALGSVVRLPDTSEFRDLAYKSTGFTMECWVHVPNIMDADTGWLSGTTSSLTKVLLGNENTGVASGVSAINYLGETPDLDFLENKKGTNFVKGLICGFTRDRRITQEAVGYSNNNADNDPASSLSFFIAPTISRDSSSLSWINNDDCTDTESFYKMKIDLSSNSLIGNVSSQFVLLDIVVEPVKNEVRFYADGTLLTTSSITNVFGEDPGNAPNLPTFRKPNSFEYTASTTDGPTTIKTGPLANQFYTPWIVGGGWTDGMYLNGNFMGGDRGGIVSGLRGHVGSLKFYSKALDTEEVQKNYNSQQGFFKNIKM
jgi:hypothetical protein